MSCLYLQTFGCMSVHYMSTWCPQKPEVDALGLELQRVRATTWVLEIEPGSLARVAIALNLRAISPATKKTFSKKLYVKSILSRYLAPPSFPPRPQT